MATNTAGFPLATEAASPGGDASAGSIGANPGTDFDGSAEGASGSSSGSMELSRGGLIAVIIVVVFVALVGSEYRGRGCERYDVNPLPSCQHRAVLCRQEERMDYEGDAPEVNEEGCRGFDAPANRVPEISEGDHGQGRPNEQA